MNRLPSNVQRLYGQRSAYPSYQAGGMVGLGGVPEGGASPMPAGAPPQAPMGAPPQAPMSADSMNMEVQRFASQHPQEVEMLRSSLMQGIQSGELTVEEVGMLAQLASVAVQNPAAYSQVRQFAVQQGIADEDDLPMEYNEGLMFILLLAAQSVQGMQGAQGAQGMQGMASPPPVPGAPSMADGGTIPQSKRSDGSVTINAHEGEYVIPANVVKMKGREFFDTLLEKYKDVE
jgi:hypothetical protein